MNDKLLRAQWLAESLSYESKEVESKSKERKEEFDRYDEVIKEVFGEKTDP